MSMREFAQHQFAIFTADDLGDCVGRKFAGTQRVIDSLAGEWFNHTRGVTDEKQILARGRDGITPKRCDRTPPLVGSETKFVVGPSAERANRRWCSNQAE